MDSSGGRQVDLLGPISVLHEHLTDALCAEVWRSVRRSERRRIWTLERLVQFWISVTLDPPRSLRQALAEAAPGHAQARYPAPRACFQAFFARLQLLDPRFFRAVFEKFLARATAGLKPCFLHELHGLYQRFGAIVIVDGSDLDPVARRLKLLWQEPDTPLPGSILAFYDPCLGTLVHLDFDANPAASEIVRTKKALGSRSPGTLLVGDRLYGVPNLFEALTPLGLWGLARRFPSVQIKEVRVLSRRKHEGGVLEDVEVVAGSDNNRATTPQRLRLFRWKPKSSNEWTIELLTNVLDPKQLSAEEGLLCYRCRWKVERLFSDLKEVLNLHHFYTANTNAVAVQVYAVAIVHTAFRVAQAQIAKQAKLPPEQISTKKLFPRLAATSQSLSASEVMFHATQRANPGMKLRKPPYGPMPWASTPLSTVLVEPRKPKPRRTKPLKEASGWCRLPPPSQRGPPVK